MINGVQHVYVVATHYRYDQAANRYYIRLRYLFYDVFGLDDVDLREFGIKPENSKRAAMHNTSIFDAPIGITAWWQLQHQHGYTPLVTRIILESNFEVPAK